MADSEGVYIAGPSRGGEGASCAEAYFLDYFAGKLWPARLCRRCQAVLGCCMTPVCP